MELVSLAIGAFIVTTALVSVRLMEGRGAFSRALMSLVRYAPWVVLLVVTVLSNWAFNRLRGVPSPLLFDQSGPWTDAFLQGLQGVLPSDLAVSMFSFVYLVVFPVLLITIPLALLSERSGEDIRTYCIALSLTVVGLFIFHLLVQSPRPALTLGSGVSALMYDHPFWGNISLDIGSRGNSFPSGHTAMTTAMLVTLVARPRARLFMLSVLVLIIIGVMYLGLHWPLDVIAGLILGAAAGVAGRRLSMRFERTISAKGDKANRPAEEFNDSLVPRV